MKVNLKIKNKKNRGSADNEDEERDSNDAENQFGDSLETFLTAIDAQSYIEISSPNPNATSSDVKYNTAELPLQASLRGENPDKQIYNLSLQSDRENKFLRFFAKEGMLNFEAEETHAMGGVLVRRYDEDDGTCEADENGDADDCSSSSSSAITMYNTRFKVYLSVNEWGMFFGSKEKTPLYVKSLGTLVAEVDETVLSVEDKEHFKTQVSWCSSCHFIKKCFLCLKTPSFASFFVILLIDGRLPLLQGYVILKNAIPKKYLKAARKNVNWQIGE